MKKYLIFTLSLLACISMTYAQDEDAGSSASDESGMGAKAGDFTGAIMFGRGNFLDLGDDFAPPAAPGNNTSWTVNSAGPVANNVSANNNGMANIIGGEVRYFITDLIAVKLSGGAIIRNTPGLQNVQYFYVNDNGDLLQGNDASSPNATWIPQYGAIESDNEVQTNINVGGEYHFPSDRFERLKPYLGAQFSYAYSSRAVYDPTVFYANVYDPSTTSGGGSFTEGFYYESGGDYFWNNGYFDPGSPSGGSGSIVDDGILVYDVGVRSAKVQGMGGSAVAGIDVYLVPGVYVGIETKPVSYLYNWNEKSPGPGLETLQAETHTWSFFSQTFFKIGFVVGKL